MEPLNVNLSIVLSTISLIVSLLTYIYSRSVIKRNSATPSGCWRCHKSWRKVQAHAMMYDSHSGIICLCEGCWEELATPDARMLYYEKVLALWEDDHKKEQVRAAVMNGN